MGTNSHNWFREDEHQQIKALLTAPAHWTQTPRFTSPKMYLKKQGNVLYLDCTLKVT